MAWKELTLTSWGRSRRARCRAARPERVRDAVARLMEAGQRGVIAYGAGRSYGDCALNDGGAAILTRRLNRLLAFDAASGEIAVEPGVTFRELLDIFLPRGWRVPVSPGTAFATIGGAVANDVHGKNHDTAGSFGDHLRGIELLLPSGEIVALSPTASPRLFAATIGGVGLTGIVLSVRFRMERAPFDGVHLSERRIADLDAFLEALASSRSRGVSAVGWVDGTARGKRLGRGVLEEVEPASENALAQRRKALRLPFDLPGAALNPATVALFNRLYRNRVPAGGRHRLVDYERFLYPLDAVEEWNRCYGRRGLRQFQCVVPFAESPAALRRMLETIARSPVPCPLVVVKTMGRTGRGLLSFGMNGYSLAADFPARPAADTVLDALERSVLDHGGQVYLAKDSRLLAAAFARMYARADEFRAVLEEIDPECRMQSDMARRLGIRAKRR